MTTKTINGRELIFVEVSDPDFHSFEIENSILWYHGSIGEVKNQTLPEGKYKLIGKASELTEIEWWGIVERQLGTVGRYNHYDLKGSYAKYGTYTMYTATESGKSLIQWLGMELQTTLIIEKVK